MSHLWSGRFDQDPDPSAFAYGVSLGFDRQLFDEDVTGSLAWTRALARAGAISADTAAAIDRGLTEILEAGRCDPAFVSGDDEDVHAFVERQRQSARLILGAPQLYAVVSFHSDGARRMSLLAFWCQRGKNPFKSGVRWFERKIRLVDFGARKLVGALDQCR